MTDKLWVAYEEIPTGTRFRFVYNPTISPRISDDVYVKGKGGWFRKETEVSYKAWRTGRTTAVLVEPQPIINVEALSI